MVSEIEFIGIGVAFISPVYAALWFLIQLGTKNKSGIEELKNDISDMNHRINKCENLTKDINNIDKRVCLIEDKTTWWKHKK
jgi:hypothetical protein